MQETSYHTALYEKNMEIIELREQHNVLLVNSFIINLTHLHDSKAGQCMECANV